MSADTTAQQLSIGYPNEPGILRGLAERCLRACGRLKRAGRKKLRAVREQAIGILENVKQQHLFAKSQEAKTVLLKAIVGQTRRLLVNCGDLRKRLSGASETLTVSALDKLRAMQDVGGKLLPQIASWIATGIIARDKILHADLLFARSIVRNKAGKKYEFGLRHLIASFKNGTL